MRAVSSLSFDERFIFFKLYASGLQIRFLFNTAVSWSTGSILLIPNNEYFSIHVNLNNKFCIFSSLCFLMSDSLPTSRWLNKLTKVKKNTKWIIKNPKLSTVFSVSIGKHLLCAYVSARKENTAATLKKLTEGDGQVT